MSTRLLLYVSRAGASLARWGRGELRDIHALPADAEGWAQLSDTLRNAPGIPVYMAVDAVEEHYRSEVLPRAWGRDRREMTQRRLRQILHQTPYRAVLSQGPASDGQIGDRYLFMGLTAPALLQPWLEVLRLRRAPVAGIWLVPVLSQALLARYRLTRGRPSPLMARLSLLAGRQTGGAADTPDQGDRLLLVSEHSGGLRLSFFDRGELRFSRLAPGEGTSHADPLAGHVEQIERTRQSLLAQRLLQRGDTLRVCLVDPLNSLEGLRQRLLDAEGWQCVILSRQRLLAELKLRPELLTESSDALSLALLAHAPAAGNLLPEDERRAQAHRRLRRLVTVTAGIWLAATAGLGLALVLDAWRLTHSADTLQARTHMARAQAAQMLEREGGSARFEALWQTHAAWRWVMAHRADPAVTLARIAAIAGRHPNLRLLQIRWAGPEPPQPQRLWLEGDVLGFDGDYRLAHGQIEALVADLRRDGWQAEVTRWSLDLAPHLEVQGDLGRDRPGRGARFGLALVAQEGVPAADVQTRALGGGPPESAERRVQ